MKILKIAQYEIIKNVRDVKMLLGLIILPIIMILILGTVLEGELNKDVKGKIAVGYLNQDDGIVGTQFNSFLDSKEIKDKLEIKIISDQASGQKAIDSGYIDLLINIEKSTSAALQKGEKQSISITGKKNVELVQTILKSYVSTVNSISVIVNITGMPVQPISDSSIVRVYGEKNVMPHAIDYYSILTLLQFLLAGAVFGVFITAKDYGTDLHIRLHSLPVTKWTLASGRLIGSVVYLFIISIIIMLFSKFVYKANYDGNMLIILGSLLIFCIFSIGFGMMIGLLVKNLSSAVTTVFLTMFLFPIASGSISPNSAIPFLNMINPNYQTKVLVFGAIYGYPQSIMIESLLYMVGFIIIIYAITTMLFRRIKSERN